MSLMTQMNSFCRLTPGKPVNRSAVTAPSALLLNVLAQLPSQCEQGGWEQIRFETGFAPPVREQIAALGADFAEGEDTFAVTGEGDTLTVYAEGIRGHLYGAYAILQQAQANGGLVPGGILYNAPQCAFRGLKVYLPAPDDIAQFYKIVDMMMYYRYNSIIIEIGGAMEYKNHPEINESWVEYCKEMARYPERADEVQHMFGWEKNSIHFENGGGTFLPQDTVRELVAYCRARGMDVIPEVPSLSHADYLLNAHQELAERPYDPFPDVYCPSNPESYRLLFEVMDEVIDVFHPAVMHIGHDEYYSIGVCERCKDRDPADIYAQDIIKIHDYLAARSIRTMYWSEKVLNCIDRAGHCFGGARCERSTSRATKMVIPATYRAIDLIPKDCWAHHWYWCIVEEHDREFTSRGMTMTYGNWDPMLMTNWQKRVEAGALGGAPSHWSTLSETSMQRNAVLFDLVFGAYLLWKNDYTDERYGELCALAFEELYLYKNRAVLDAPHFEITHTTTISRPHVYISSAPMLLEKDTVGFYTVEYKSGRTLRIPIIYGVNITGASRNWQRTMHPDWDCFQVDGSLYEVSFTTMPRLRPDGATEYTFVVPNPNPEDPVVSVRVEKTAPDDGELLLNSFIARQPLSAGESGAFTSTGAQAAVGLW